MEPRPKRTWPASLRRETIYEKTFSTGAAVDIFGDHVVTFSGLGLGKLEDDVTLFVLVNKELADGYRKWFQFMWDHCKVEK